MKFSDYTIGEDAYRAAAKRIYEIDGKLYWLNGRNAGRPVATHNYSRGGHLTFGCAGKTMMVHRMVWFLHTGQLPEHVLDHVNDDPTDNRFENLRDVTQRVNHHSNKRCGRETFAGMASVEQRGVRWLVSGCVSGLAIRKVYLGSYATQAEAEAAAEGADRLKRFLERPDTRTPHRTPEQVE